MKKIRYILKIIGLELRQDKWLLLLDFMSTLAEKSKNVLVVILPAFVIDCVSERRPGGKDLLFIAGIALAVSTFDFMRAVIKKILSIRGERADNRIRMDLNKKKMNSYFLDAVSAEGQKSEEKAVNALSEFLETDYLIFHEILGAVYSLALMGYALFQMGFISGVIILANAFFHYFTARRKNRIIHGLADTEAETTYKLKYIRELMFHCERLKDIRIYEGRELIAGKYEKLLEESICIKCKKERAALFWDVLSIIVSNLQILVIYCVAIYCVRSSDVSLGIFALLVSASKEVGSSLSDLLEAAAGLSNVALYYGDYEEYMESSHDISALGAETVSRNPSEFCLEIENVSFTYPESTRKTVDNISFSIKWGEVVSIVGDNGAGKTTLILLILRLLKPDSGRICLNGTDIEEIAYSEYIKMLAPVFQDFEPFSETVRENIVLDKQYDEMLFRECCTFADFEKVVDKLSDCEKTILTKEIDENGVELSGGEKQKLAVARARYHCGKLLIMDEPTAAIDPLSEYRIYRSIYEKNNGSVLFISHRLTSTLFSDKIVVMRNGRMVECGKHDDLMKSGGMYAEMYQKQAYYYKENQ